MIDKEIDVVILYVDSEDEEWVKLYQYHKHKNIEDKKEENVRYRNTSLLKWLFRSIDTNLDWINNVFLVVQSESQVPKWVNRETVKVVLHEEFIPKEYLPTYNSSTIEIFLHNIKDLSNNFILCNDDFLFYNKCNVIDFFENDKLKFGYSKKYINEVSDCLYYYGVHNTTQAFFNYFDIKVNDNLLIVPSHYAKPFYKPNMKKCYETFMDRINESITMFRCKKNYVYMIYCLYQIKSGKFKKESPGGKAVSLRNYYKYPEKYDNFKCLCINDNIIEGDYKKAYNKTIEILDKKFPNISKYEI